MFKYKIPRGLALLVSALLLHGCATVPETGRRQLLMVDSAPSAFSAVTAYQTVVVWLPAAPTGAAAVASGAPLRKVPVMSCGAVMRVLTG